jgi:hypothetical protein
MGRASLRFSSSHQTCSRRDHRLLVVAVDIRFFSFHRFFASQLLSRRGQESHPAHSLRQNHALVKIENAVEKVERRIRFSEATAAERDRKKLGLFRY